MDSHIFFSPLAVNQEVRTIKISEVGVTFFIPCHEKNCDLINLIVIYFRTFVSQVHVNFVQYRKFQKNMGEVIVDIL